VNKLDLNGWSIARYEEIVGKVDPFLKQIGFRHDNIAFCPISGLNGTNLIESANDP
jgi:translation elongation factor EF-1alpha